MLNETGPVTAGTLANACCCAESAVFSPLEVFVCKRWSQLIQRSERIIVNVLLSSAHCVRCELFVGDEFRSGKAQLVDVVLRSQDEQAEWPCLAVLVFDKASRRLVEYDLGTISLNVPVSACS